LYILFLIENEILQIRWIFICSCIVARLLQNSSLSLGSSAVNDNVNNNTASSNALSNSHMKKKSVRKAVNLSELQRYFKAAEEAAREIMLEEAIHIQRLAETSNQVYDAGASETEGVIQLTTLSSLPLKSPKRLIALQLANNNPAFRERFRQKLESSGGPIVPRNPVAGDANFNNSSSNDNNNNNDISDNNSNKNNNAGNVPASNLLASSETLDQVMGEPSASQGDQDVHDMLAMSEIEKYLQSASPLGPGSNNPLLGSSALTSSSTKVANTNSTSKRRSKKVEKQTQQTDGSVMDLDDFVANEQLNQSPDKINNDDKKEKKVRKPRKSKKEEESSEVVDIDNNNNNTTPNVPKKRGRKKKQAESDDMMQLSLNLKPPFYDDGFSDDQDDNNLDNSDVQPKSKQRKVNSNHNNNSQNTKGGDGSIIKRRRKGELRVVVDGGLNLVGSAHKHNLHSLLGGGLSDMGPPTFNLDGTTNNNERRSSQRLKSGAPLSSLSNLNTLSNLDSPYNGGRSNNDGGSGEKHQHPLLGTNGELLLLGSGFGIDTPGTLSTTRGLFDLKSNGLLTSSGLGLITGGGTESVRFDFDEVAAHFPSPRAGEHVKGSSPYRWSAGSTGSMNSGFFSFSDGVLSARNSSFGGAGTSFSNSSIPLNPLADPVANNSNNHNSSSFMSNPPSSSSKHRKAHRRSEESSDTAELSNSNNNSSVYPSSTSNSAQQQSSSNSSEGNNTTVFQSPVRVASSVTNKRASRRNNHNSHQDRSAMGEDGDNAGLMHPPDSSTRKRMALDFSDDLDTPTALKLALGAPGHL
jgi:hypothetical protein